MTPISEMQAGRELDALVAEKVMGFPAKTLEEWGDDWYPGLEDRQKILIGRWFVPDPEDPICWMLTDDPSLPEAELHPCHATPQYSTRIEYAWQVVEKMDERGYHWSVDSGKLKCAQFCKHGQIVIFRRKAKTTMLAICQAAVAAMEERHEGSSLVVRMPVPE